MTLHSKVMSVGEDTGNTILQPVGIRKADAGVWIINPEIISDWWGILLSFSLFSSVLNYWNCFWLMGYSTQFSSVLNNWTCVWLMRPFHTPSLCFEQSWNGSRKVDRLSLLLFRPKQLLARQRGNLSNLGNLRSWDLKILRSWDLEILRPRSVEITIGTWVPIPKTLTWCKLGDTPFWATSHLTRMIWDCQKLQKIQLPSQRLAN